MLCVVPACVFFKDAAVPLPSARRVRFNQFASMTYEDEPYMTPRDFLFSVMLEDVDRKKQHVQTIQSVLLKAHS